jgi:hypothetical protein
MRISDKNRSVLNFVYLGLAGLVGMFGSNIFCSKIKYYLTDFFEIIFVIFSKH